MSERRHHTLLDMLRLMMSQSYLSLSFWGYALETTPFTLNDVPSKLIDNTPYEIWTGKRHNFVFQKMLGLWGICEATLVGQVHTQVS